MHRSGTSAITRVLSLLGADLPRTLDEPRADNVAGFWEPPEIVQLHDELLEALGSSWDDTSALPRRWFESPQAGVFAARLRELAATNFGESSLFVLKDPRICRLIPVWLRVFDDLGASPGFVLPIRNPLEVAESLRERNGFSFAKSFLLWLRHVLDAERDTRGFPRTLVSYERLLRDWMGELERVSNELDLAWPRFSDASRVEIEGFLSGELRHHRFALEDVEVRPDVAAWVKSVYVALVAATREGDPSEVLDEVGRKLDEADAVFGPLLAEWASQGRAASTLREELVARDEELRGLRSHLDGVERTVAARDEAIHGLRSHLDGVERTVAARDEAIHGLRSQLEDVEGTLAARDEEMSGLRSQLQDLVELRNGLRAAQRTAEDLRRQLRSEQGKLETSERHVSRLDEELFDRTGRLRHAQEEAEKLRVENLALAEVLEGSNAEKTRLLEEIRDLHEAHAKEMQLFSEAHASEVARLQQVIALHEAEGTQLRREVEKLEGEVARLTEEMERRVGRFRRFFSLRFRSGSQLLSWILRPSSRQRRRWVREYLALRRSGAFDADFYLRTYPDVARARLNPLMHYIEHGAYEGRNPSPDFHTLRYVAANREVTHTGVNPLFHSVKAKRKAGEPLAKEAAVEQLQALFGPERVRDDVSPRTADEERRAARCSIVIPVRDTSSLDALLEEFAAELDVEIVLVDERSTDSTFAVRRLRLRSMGP